MWVAGKPLTVKVEGGGYESRKIGDPVPEAPGWTFRNFEAHKSLGWIRWVDLDTRTAPPKRKRRRNVKHEV